ncbi:MULTISPECIES: cell division protein ZapA [Clostridium]|jgi:cell division protein ZapA|uniref:cell division protein ZapA n=1 Tax=Clostridium TaxID=1485 RepID=UPI00028A18CF|nr:MULTISPECIES: cell division protein ZapA [Clostridium]MDF2505899.1 hypothetical protein [Clostridium sp.]
MSSVTVRVNNKEYKLKGDEREEYLHTVATYVDKKIKNIMENNSKLSTAEASILTAMNLADDLFKAGHYNEKLSDEIEKLKNNKKDDNVKIEELKDELTRINAEKEQLLVKLEELKSNDDSNKKDKQIEELSAELKLKKENNKKYIDDVNRLKADNKQLKFNLQTAKYKMIDLENKYLEGQIDLAKSKKEVVKHINKK